MFQMVRGVRVNGPVMRQKEYKFHNCGEAVNLEYLTFDSLEETGIVKHLFTTRTGGVSEGVYSSLNFSVVRGDSPEAVIRNYERVAKVLGCETGDIVASHQTHTTNIRRVTAEDKGKGVTLPRDYENVDGLITNERGIALATFYADCVPLYFVDCENRAIGLAHSGWRGTVKQMGTCMVQAMQEQFGSKPEHLIAAIGPSICQDCYEVSEEVAFAFEELLAAVNGEEIMKEIAESKIYSHGNHKSENVIVPGKAPGKYQLDLWLANLIILRNAGIQLSQIAITDVCTCHNPDYLFSHRVSGERRGNLGAFLLLK